MGQVKQGSYDLTLTWRSQFAVHKDRLHVDAVDLVRAIFPADMKQAVSQLDSGETVRLEFEKGTLVPSAHSSNIITFDEALFETQQGPLKIKPAVGRFYPQGLASAALNCARNNFTPFRLITHAHGKMVADKNHPLSLYPLRLETRCIKHKQSVSGQKNIGIDIAEWVTHNGPGMQAPYIDRDTDFFSPYPFRQSEDLDDESFYQSPRLVNHLDSTAIAQVKKIYARLLKPGDYILDLMSSFVSHIPEDLDGYSATGLGMNAEELQANPQLSDHVVHNLNRQPELPFGDDQYDAVLCTVSVEYLTHPIEIFREVGRVTRKGGIFVITFSNRWFPGKEIQPWSEMHPFERMGLVLDFFRKSGCFECLQTESIRGIPRPLQDPHVSQTQHSDPIFAVYGKVSK